MAKDSPIEAGPVPAGAVSPAANEPARQKLRRRVDEGGFWTIPPAGPKALNAPGEPPAVEDPEPRALEEILAGEPVTDAGLEPNGAEPDGAEPDGAEPATEQRFAVRAVPPVADATSCEGETENDSAPARHVVAAEPATPPEPTALAARAPIESERVKPRDRREGPRMFGRQPRRDLRVVEAIREEMSAADLQVRTMLAETVAQIESRLTRDREERERAQLSADTALEHVRATVSQYGTAMERVLQVFEQTARAWELMAERIEADRMERRALTEAITLLAGQQSTLLGRPRVIGGTVFSPSEAAPVADRTNGSGKADAHLPGPARDPAANGEPAGDNALTAGPPGLPRMSTWPKWTGLRRWLIEGS